MAIINNTAERIITVTNLHGAGGTVIIQPGINEINDEIWGQIRGQLGDKINSKVIVEKGIKLATEKGENPPNLPAGTPPVQKVTSADSFSKLDVKEATALIGETVDTNLLKKWAEDEKRDGVLGVINKRLEELSPKKD